MCSLEGAVADGGSRAAAVAVVVGFALLKSSVDALMVSAFTKKTVRSGDARSASKQETQRRAGFFLLRRVFSAIIVVVVILIMTTSATPGDGDGPNTRFGKGGGATRMHID